MVTCRMSDFIIIRTENECTVNRELSNCSLNLMQNYKL